MTALQRILQNLSRISSDVDKLDKCCRNVDDKVFNYFEKWDNSLSELQQK